LTIGGAWVEKLLFSKEIRAIFQQSPETRLASMITLHAQIAGGYCQVVESIDEARAVKFSTDGRQMKQVIGHIMEWERFTILCLAQLVSGVKTRKVLWTNGYVDLEGIAHSFDTIDAFNEFQADQHRTTPWSEIKRNSLYTSRYLLKFLSNSILVTPQILEDSEVINPKLYDGEQLAIPSAWFLWYVTLDHEAVEHAQDLYG
jgi:hypothetical protein